MLFYFFFKWYNYYGENTMERLKPKLEYGLNDRQVQEQIKRGLIHKDITVSTRSISNIIMSNIFTLFNLLNFFFAILLFIVGSYKNVMFLGVVFCNTTISIIQEIRAKKEVDKLKLMSEPKVKVIRNGKEKNIHINEIVLDDLLKLTLGNQVVVDCIILDGKVEVNESFITGESEPVLKKTGDLLLSGSFIVSGSCTSQVEHIGLSNYSSKISSEAKYVKQVNSLLLNSLNKIIKIISVIIFPLGFLLFLNQFYRLENTFSSAIVNTVAALIAMIPEGLVLLTSTVLAVSVLKLSKYKVLIKQLYCIETLARVDTICFDKTGTLTKGEMQVKDYISLHKKYSVPEIMNNFCSQIKEDNATMKALKKFFLKKSNNRAKEVIPFSSERKYTEVTYVDGSCYRLGAPEIILKEVPKELEQYEQYRVLLLAKIEKEIIPIGYILLEDTLRGEVVNTIKYFKEQQVNIKVISGDNPRMISKIMERLGLEDRKYVDCTKVSNEELKEKALTCSIFGRVSPFQKRELIKILQQNGKTVAMVGDGVNDVLALKQSDCSISFACGSQAAYDVSDLVLLDSEFKAVPSIVKEGRRTINNIERSASLYIVKTGYAILLTFLFMIIPFQYPFIPIQLTLTSALTIGIPSFILALEPNDKKVTGNFLSNVFKKAIPTSLMIVLHILIITLLPISKGQSSTLSVLIVGFIGFVHIYRICNPLKPFHILMLIVLIICFLVGVIGLNELFSLTVINIRMILIILLLMINCLVQFKIGDIINQNLSKLDKY